MFTLDHAAIKCNESTGIDKLLSDRYSRIHFSNSGLLFFTTGAGSGLVSATGSLMLLVMSAVVVVVFSSGLEVPSVE